MNDFYSDKKLEKLFGRRVPGGIVLFEPQELGWNCPKESRHTRIHNITWSEFLDHIWCYQCEKDYFILLCPKRMNSFTTEDILKAEKKNVNHLIAQWSLARYKNCYKEKKFHVKRK